MDHPCGGNATHRAELGGPAECGPLGARDELPRLFVEMTHRGMAEGLGDKALTAVIDVLAGEGKTAG